MPPSLAFNMNHQSSQTVVILAVETPETSHTIPLDSSCSKAYCNETTNTSNRVADLKFDPRSASIDICTGGGRHYCGRCRSTAGFNVSIKPKDPRVSMKAVDLQITLKPRDTTTALESAPLNHLEDSEGVSTQLSGLQNAGISRPKPVLPSHTTVYAKVCSDFLILNSC